MIDYSVDLIQSLLWQHNNAPRISALVMRKQEWYTTNQSQFWSNWVRDVFDLRTANKFGLKVWSIILGIPLNINTNPQTGAKNWGFGDDNKNFNNGNFGQIGSTSATLQPDDARILLQLRYFQLVGRPTLPEINRFLEFAFRGRGKVVASDPLNMEYVIYTFDDIPNQTFVDILLYFDVLPRPAGVGVAIKSGTRRPVFGFGEYNRNFNNGTFAGE